MPHTYYRMLLYAFFFFPYRIMTLRYRMKYQAPPTWVLTQLLSIFFSYFFYLFDRMIL
jgi:hypothetical protein